MDVLDNVRIIWDEKTGKILDIEELPINTRVENNLLIPCFLNAHVHLGDSFIKDIGFNQPLKDLVAPPDGLKHHFLKNTASQEIMQHIRISLYEMLSNGIHGFLDFREGSLDGYKIIHDALLDVYYPQFGKILVRPDKTSDGISKLVEKIQDDERVLGFNISSPNDWDVENMRILQEKLVSIILNHNMLIATHIAETSNNPVKSMSLFGQSDANRMLSAFSEVAKRLILVHCNYLKKEDISMIDDFGSSIVFCPRIASLYGNINMEAEYYKSIIERGLVCALGTDNVMFNSPDMFQEVNFFTRMLKMLYPTWKLEPATILKMATINPAKILGIDNLTGSIEKGKYASFFTLDASSPVFEGTKSPMLALLLRAHPGLISKIFIQGKTIN